MPIPTPSSGESTSDFMSRCISFLVGEGKPQDQASAICADRARESGRRLEKMEEVDLDPQHKVDLESTSHALHALPEPEEIDLPPNLKMDYIREHELERRLSE